MKAFDRYLISYLDKTTRQLHTTIVYSPIEIGKAYHDRLYGSTHKVRSCRLVYPDELVAGEPPENYPGKQWYTIGGIPAGTKKRPTSIQIPRRHKKPKGG